MRTPASSFRQWETRAERGKHTPWKCRHNKPLLCEQAGFLMHRVSCFWTMEVLSSAMGEIACQGSFTQRQDGEFEDISMC